MSNDVKTLVRELNKVGATRLQTRMAAILLSVNGLENSLEFVHGIPQRQKQQAPPENGGASDSDSKGETSTMTDLFSLIPGEEPAPQVATFEATTAPEPVETPAATEAPAEMEASAAPESEPAAVTQVIEEIDTSPKATVAKAVTKPVPYKREEPPPNPLILDPYEWDQCTITVGYSLLPDKKVSVSVHNHKDDPIVKEFPAEEVPLPEKISQVMATLQSIFPTSPVNATVVLLPKPENAPERPIIASVRVSTDTPIVQEGVESNLPFPAPIVAMLDELKALMPERALKNIEKNAKAKAAATPKTVAKHTATKPAAKATAPAAKKRNDHSDNLTLF